MCWYKEYRKNEQENKIKRMNREMDKRQKHADD